MNLLRSLLRNLALVKISSQRFLRMAYVDWKNDKVNKIIVSITIMHQPKLFPTLRMDVTLL